MADGYKEIPVDPGHPAYPYVVDQLTAGLGQTTISPFPPVRNPLNDSTNTSSLIPRYGQQPNLDRRLIDQMEMAAPDTFNRAQIPPEVSYEEWQLERRLQK